MKIQTQEDKDLKMFASMAMQGILASQTEKRAYGGYNSDSEVEYIVEESFMIGQKMLDEFNKLTSK